MFHDLGLAYLDPDFLKKIKSVEEIRKGSLILDKDNIKNKNNNTKKKRNCC
jgi:hypothetical protein